MRRYEIFASEVIAVNPTFQPWMWSQLGWFDRADLAAMVYSRRGDAQTSYLFATRNPNVFENITFFNDIGY